MFSYNVTPLQRGRRGPQEKTCYNGLRIYKRLLFKLKKTQPFSQVRFHLLKYHPLSFGHQSVYGYNTQTFYKSRCMLVK